MSKFIKGWCGPPLKLCFDNRLGFHTSKQICRQSLPIKNFGIGVSTKKKSVSPHTSFQLKTF